MRVVAILPRTRAYDSCFYPALVRQGVEVVDERLTRRWVARHLRRGDVIHVQFPSFSYAGSARRPVVVRRFARFVVLLGLARLRGARVVWTAHNLLPHEPTPVAGLDRLGRRIVVALSDRVFVHGATAASLVRARFPAAADKLTIIDHGSWAELYPCTRSESAARAGLGIAPGTYVYAFVGACRRYKNLERLIATFGACGDGAALVITGEFRDPAYEAHIASLAARVARVRLFPGRIAPENMQDVLLAADSVVLPYHDILTSGAVMLPLTFGRPVVSLNAGHLRDVVSPEVGLLFDRDDPDGLARAMREVRARSFDADRIRAHAARFSWDDSAAAFVAALASARRADGRGDAE